MTFLSRIKMANEKKKIQRVFPSNSASNEFCIFLAPGKQSQHSTQHIMLLGATCFMPLATPNAKCWNTFDVVDGSNRAF